VKPLPRYLDVEFSEDGGSRHVVLVKFDVFTIGTVKNIEQRHCANFGRNRSKHGGDMSLIHFSRWEPPPSSFLGNLKFITVGTVHKVEMHHCA